MAPNSSPSATMTSAGVAIAYADQNGKLCVFDPVLGFGGYGAPVAANTSPAITYILGLADGYRITYQAPDHLVHTADSTSTATPATPLIASVGTSPAITTLPSGEIDIVVSGRNSVSGGSDNELRVMASTGVITTLFAASQEGTSPSIAPAAGGGWVAAWQNGFASISTFVLGTGVTGTGLSIDPRTSPSIAQITSTRR